MMPRFVELASCIAGKMHDLFRNEAGATAIEYAIIVGGVSIAIIASVMALGTAVQEMYQTVLDTLP